MESPGTSFMASLIAKRFAGEVAQNVNMLLGERRWSIVLEGLTKLEDGVQRLQAGTHRLADGLQTARDGSQRLAGGTQTLAHGTERLTQGLLRIKGAVTLMDHKMPSPLDLNRLADGSRQVTEGQQRLQDGLQILSQGSEKLSEGSRRLTTGMDQLSEGSRQIQDGTHRLAGGARLVASKNGELAAGLSRLAHGSHQLKSGMDLLANHLQQNTWAADPHQMVVSAVVEDQAVGPSMKNGPAFAPYFIALSLWMGAVLTVFLLPYTALPESLRGSRQRTRLLSKLTLPGIVVVGQSLVVFVVLQAGLHLPVPHAGSFLMILLAGSLTFLAVVTSLLFLLGDAGRLVAIVLLVVQLAAAGGPYPIELSPPFFQAIHPFMPITNLVKALRASLFGAYGADWPWYAGSMLLVGWIALLVAWLAGRRKWKFVPDPLYAPALDL